MKMNHVMAVASVALLAGCDGGGGDAPAPTTVQVKTISGAMHSLSGSYDAGCVATSEYSETSGLHDFGGTIAFSGAAFTSERVWYASSNRSCTGGVVKRETWVDVVTSTNTTAAISGWLDMNEMPTDPPLANDGSSVGNSVSYTPLTDVEHAFYLDGAPSAIAADGSPMVLESSYLYFIVDDTPGGPIRMWANACDIAGDAQCKALADGVVFFTKI